MKRFTPANAHLRVAVPAVGMLKLLEGRKATLGGMIRERFRQAHENGTTAAVKMLSATLRAVKRQIATVNGHGGMV